MKQGDRRISELNLADTVAAAIAIESERIHLLDGAMVEQVSGGVSTESTPTTGPTMGYVPTDNVAK